MGKNTNKRHQISALIAAIVITSAIVLYWLSVEIRKIQTAEIKNVFSYSTSKIENSLSDTVKHTEYVMRMLNNQIVQKPKDYNYLNDIISKFKIDSTMDGALPWTVFSWADQNQRIVVDGTYGIIANPPDLSGRDYMPLTVSEPGILHMGRPVMGIPSNKWVIPGGVGYVDDKGTYLGATTIGLDLNLMAKEITRKIDNDKIKFIIADKNSNLLIDSSKKIQGPINEKGKLPIAAQKYIFNQESGTEYDIDITGGKNSSVLQESKDYPYIIYVTYDAATVRNIFLDNLLSRIGEILFVAVVAIVIAYLVYRKERILRKESDRLRKLALRQAKAKNEFLAYTGHELRSPLNAILMGSEMIQSKMFGDLHPKYYEYIEDIHQNGMDLLHFIEDLVDATRAEDGNFSLNKEVVDINACIKRVINLNMARAAKSGIRIETCIEDNIPEFYADPKRLRQILNNLVSNSLKYSPDKACVKILIHSIDDITQIIVEDEGFGMTSEQLEVALSKYGTVDNQNTGKVESIGLGLPLVKNLVEAHGAKFEIESEKDVGTKVTISFPVYKKMDPAKEPLPHNPNIIDINLAKSLRKAI